MRIYCLWTWREVSLCEIITWGHGNNYATARRRDDGSSRRQLFGTAGFYSHREIISALFFGTLTTHHREGF